MPKRKGIRLSEYDYSQNGYYFVTVCARDKQPIFWESVPTEKTANIRAGEYHAHLYPVGADAGSQSGHTPAIEMLKILPNSVGADDPVRPQRTTVREANIRPCSELTELIKDGTPSEMLSLIGRIVKQCWEEINTIYPNVRTDYYVIMPDHFHGIIVIDNPIQPFVCGRTGLSVGGRTGSSAPTEKPTDSIMGECHTSPYPVCPSLPKIMQGFKSVTTRQCFQYGYRQIWQRGYFEHIIRNHDDYINTAKYIMQNPQKLLTPP